MAILLTNDDGIYAEGLMRLTSAMRELDDVVVVAPDREQSAVGHAITLSGPLRLTRIMQGEKFLGYATNGTPADAVKLAVKVVLPEPPKLVISGINLGANVGASLIYSGTVSAATEGTLLGIPSIAISIDSRETNNFDPASLLAKTLAKKIMEKGLPEGVLLNVNVPDLPIEEIKGIKIVAQGRTNFDDFFEVREDPRGQKYFWMCGTMVADDSDPEHDVNALKNGYITIAPIHYDLTARDFLSELKSWDISLK